MMLMPTNCWKVASMMPAHTIGRNTVPGAVTSRKLGRRSLEKLALISPILRFACSSPNKRVITVQASSSHPRLTRYRGLAGMKKSATRNTTASTACARYIQRQASTPAISPSELPARSEEHTSELSHVKISYAVFCLKKKKQTKLYTK